MCDENGTMMLGYYLECHVSRDTPKKVIWHVLHAGPAGIAIQKKAKITLLQPPSEFRV
jgi:hypothetical protein